MSEPKNDATLYIKSRRLLQMRMPLFLLLGLNFVLVCAVPFSQIYGKTAQGVTHNSFDKAKVTGATDGGEPAIDESSEEKVETTPNSVDEKHPTKTQVIEQIEANTEPNPEAGVIEVTEKELKMILGSNQLSESRAVTPTDKENVETTLENAAPQPLDPMIAMAMQNTIRTGVSRFTQGYARQLEILFTASDKSPVEPSATTLPVDGPPLKLHNPSHWDVEIHYVVDGEIRTIRPGESHDLGSNDRAKRIEFHRGGEFADALYELAEGSFDFRVSTEGWELVQDNGTEDAVDEQIP